MKPLQERRLFWSIAVATFLAEILVLGLVFRDAFYEGTLNTQFRMVQESRLNQYNRPAYSIDQACVQSVEAIGEGACSDRGLLTESVDPDTLLILSENGWIIPSGAWTRYPPNLVDDTWQSIGRARLCASGIDWAAETELDQLMSCLTMQPYGFDVRLQRERSFELAGTHYLALAAPALLGAFIILCFSWIRWIRSGRFQILPPVGQTRSDDELEIDLEKK